MKKILASAILAALLLGALWALTGCTGLRAGTYANPERYSVGDAVLEHVDAVELESASGGMQISAASLDSLSVRSTSGEVDCALASVPPACSIHAVSGDVALSLPADADFTADVRTTSGDLASDFAMRRDGGSYVCGSGSAHIRIETTSGDVAIRSN